MRRERAAAHEHDGLRCITVEFENLLRDGGGQVLDVGSDGLQHFLGGQVILLPEDVGEAHVLAVAGLTLDLFGYVEVQQEFL